MKPYPYQQKFIDENPTHAILAWEMRVGKSLPAAIWIDAKEQRGNTYIITPKQNKKDWIAYKTKATVLTKEEFKKTEITDPTAIVIDEAHYFASALFVRRGKGRSQLSEKMYSLVRNNPDMHVLLLTATPIRQDAWSLHTLLCYIGVYYDWKKWREKFFEQEAMPFLPRPKWMKPWETPAVWVPKSDWRTTIRPILEKHCNIISLRDIVDYLPPIDPQIIKIKQSKYIKPFDKTWVDEHLHEQKGKHKEVLRFGYEKMIVVAHYTEQIDDLKTELSKEKTVYVLDGRTKDATNVKKAAQTDPDCYFIVQSSMGFGFDGYMFSAIVFVSMSHSCLNHTQMLGRMRHPKHLKSVPAYYIQGGRWDERIYKTIEQGKDFNPHIYRHE